MIEVGTSLGDMHGLSLSYIKRLLDGDEGRPVGHVEVNALTSKIRKIHNIVSLRVQDGHKIIEKLINSDDVEEHNRKLYYNKFLYYIGVNDDHNKHVVAYSYDDKIFVMAEVDLK
jgi:hypothetical protein